VSHDEQVIYVTPDGAEFPLFDRAGRRYLNEVAGLGMPPVQHVTRRGYGQDGETHLATRLKPRTVSLKVSEVYPDRNALWDGHLDWFATLAPGDDAGLLRKVFPDGRTFDLPVRFRAGADAGDREQFGAKVQDYALQLVAHDPVWCAADETRMEAAGYDGDQLVFPAVFPIWFDGKTILGAFDIAYPGSWRTWPTVELTGPMINPRLSHEERGVVVQLLDVIPAGYVVTLAIDPEGSSVTNQAGTDLAGRLSEQTDLQGFYLAPGANTLRVRAAGTSGASKAVLRYYERYVGI